MNAYQLFRQDGTPVNLWSCGQCNHLYGPPHASQQAKAERCCTPVPCRSCGQPTDKNYNYNAIATCGACESVARHEREANLIEKAEKLEDWDGWVWWNDRYFPDLNDLVEHLECKLGEDDEWPEWVHTCTENSFPGLDIDNLIDNISEELGFEDAADSILGKAELGKAIDAFNEANNGVVSYDWDMGRVVRVPKREEE